MIFCSCLSVGRQGARLVGWHAQRIISVGSQTATSTSGICQHETCSLTTHWTRHFLISTKHKEQLRLMGMWILQVCGHKPKALIWAWHNVTPNEPVTNQSVGTMTICVLCWMFPNCDCTRFAPQGIIKIFLTSWLNPYNNTAKLLTWLQTSFLFLKD